MCQESILPVARLARLGVLPCKSSVDYNINILKEGSVFGDELPSKKPFDLMCLIHLIVAFFVLAPCT